MHLLFCELWTLGTHFPGAPVAIQSCCLSCARAGGPVSTTGGPVHAVTWHRYLRTDFPGEHSFVTRKGTTMQCPEIGRGRNLRGEPPMRSLTLFALLQTWGKEDTSELLGMAALPPHSPLLSSQEHAPEQSNPSPISLN